MTYKVDHMIPPNSDIQDRLRRIERSLDLVGSLLVTIEISDGVKKAVTLIDFDPDMALGRTRKVLDFIISDLYKREFEKPPGTQPLENLVQQLSKAAKLPRTMVAYANSVRELGNVGIHGTGEAITADDVVSSLENLMRLVAWYCERVRTGEEPEGEMTPSSEATKHYLLGWEFEEKGDVEGAIAEFREATRLEPKWPQAHMQLCIQLRKKHELDGAVSECREVLRLDPGYWYARIEMGRALFAKGNFDGAIAEYLARPSV